MYVEYEWHFVSKPEGSTATLPDPWFCRPTFVADVDGTYILQLKTQVGTERTTATNTDRVNITASSGNCPPVAEAGPHQEVKPDTRVTLDGSGSSDADNDPLTLQLAHAFTAVRKHGRHRWKHRHARTTHA